MARQPRFEYSGAVYHVMARGNGGDAVFVTDDDRKSFLHRLGQVCESHGWRIHAWVLMGNHFHLLLETPQPNLVSGMKWLLSAYSQGWNRARLRTHTSVSNAWIAEHLAMGHPGSVSRSVSAGRATKEMLKNADKLGRMLKCVL